MITLELSKRVVQTNLIVLVDKKDTEYTLSQNIIKINISDSSEHTIQLVEALNNRSRKVIATDGDYFFVDKQFAWWSFSTWLIIIIVMLTIIACIKSVTSLRVFSVLLWSLVAYYHMFKLNIIKYNDIPMMNIK